MSENPTFPTFVDISRTGDLGYVLQDEICKYLYQTKLEDRFDTLIKEGEDPEYLLSFDPEFLYQSFREALRQISAENELHDYVREIFDIKVLRKVFIHETCVVCLDKPSNVILDCSHQSICHDCFKTLNSYRCPLCRKSITLYIDADLR